MLNGCRAGRATLTLRSTRPRLSLLSITLLAVVFISCFVFPREVSAQAAKAIFVEVSGRVLDQKENPIAGATVRIDGPTHRFASTDAGGHFVFGNVSPGTYAVRVEADGFDSFSRGGIVVQNEDINLEFQLSTKNSLKEIGHVSTSSGSGSINITAAPSYQSSPDDLAAQGQTQWRKVLEELPGISISNSSGSTAGGISDSPNAEQVVSIRGSLPYETAMLIDNMPMYGISSGTLSSGAGSGTDLSPYDPQAFASYDVIEGPGAQSPSIIDTIGGSLNLHPAGQVTENHYSFSLQNDPYGGLVGGGLAALREGKLSATFTYGLNDSPGPLGVSSTQLLTSFFGSAVATVNGQPFKCGASCASSFGYPPGYVGNVGSTSTGLVACCTTINTGWVQHNGATSLFYQFSRSLVAQFFYAGQNQSVPTSQEYFPTTFLPPVGYTGSVPAGTSPQMFEDISNLAIGQSSNIFEGKIIAQLGNGELQLAALNNQTKLNYGLNAPLLTSSTPTTLRLYGGGTVNGVNTVFNGDPEAVTFISETYGYIDATNNRDLSVSYATPLGESARATVSYVHSYYDNPLALSEEYDGIDYSVPPQSNFVTTDEVRIGFGVNPTARTSLDLSGYLIDARFHVTDPTNAEQTTYVDEDFHYSTPRLAFVWRPTNSLAWRASAGGGIALAPLGYLVGTNGAPLLSNGIYSQYLPNLNLQPEHSSSVDVGVDKSFGHGTVLSLDLYGTNLYGQLYSDQDFSGEFNGLPLYTTEYRNLAESRYQGIDAQLRHDVPHGFVWGASASLTRAYVVSVPAGFYNTTTCTNCTNLYVVPGPNFNGAYGPVAVPYTQGYGTIGYKWSSGRFANLEMVYFGNNNGYFRPAFVAFNANVEFPITKNVAIQGTFRNITNIYGAQIRNVGEGVGAPTVSGPAYYLPSANYEPRALIVSLRFHS